MVEEVPVVQSNMVELRSTTLIEDHARVGESGLFPGALVMDPAAFSQELPGGSPGTSPGAVWDPLDRVFRDRNYGMRRRVYRDIVRSHNTRLNVGRDQIQRIGTLGDVGANLNGLLVAYTGTTATTLTGAAGLPTAASSAGNTGLQGHWVYVQNSTIANSVVGVIVSNTATAITVDQWYALPLTGAVGTTPTSAAGNAFVMFGGTNPWWVALSTSSAAAVATDVTRTADGLWGDGTGGGAATEQTASGLARAYMGQGGGTAPTVPGAGQEQFNHTWTYTGAVLVTIPKVVSFNSLAVAGTIPMFESLLAPGQASVNANGDTIQLAGWLYTF
jgi:hypothetical protein